MVGDRHLAPVAGAEQHLSAGACATLVLPDLRGGTMSDRGEIVRRALMAGLERAEGLNRAPAEALVRRARSAQPEPSPAEVITHLEKRYRQTVISFGAASGASAAAPMVTTGVSLLTAPVEIGAFLEATAIFATAVAEVHGVHVDDPDLRRMLILAVILGNSGPQTVEKAAERLGAGWGKRLVDGVPKATLDRVNKRLVRNFVTKYGTKQGVLVLGRAVPFFIGGAIGAAGNAALAQGSIVAARRIFGDPPRTFPDSAPRSAASGLGNEESGVIDGEIVRG